MNKFLFLLFFPFILSAQQKGEVFDAETHKPIPYVNIWVEGEQIGTTSEENGSFTLAISEEKNIVFSSLGYETKTISSKEIAKVYLQPRSIILNEIVLEKPKTKKQKILVNQKIEEYIIHLLIIKSMLNISLIMKVMRKLNL